MISCTTFLLRDHGINGVRDIHKLCVNLDVPVLHVIGQVKYVRIKEMFKHPGINDWKLKANDKRSIFSFQSVYEDCCNSRTQRILQEGPSRYGIESNPALVYYEKEVPAVFEGDLDVTDSGILSLCKRYEI